MHNKYPDGAHKELRVKRWTLGNMMGTSQPQQSPSWLCSRRGKTCNVSSHFLKMGAVEGRHVISADGHVISLSHDKRCTPKKVKCFFLFQVSNSIQGKIWWPTMVIKCNTSEYTVCTLYIMSAYLLKYPI